MWECKWERGGDGVASSFVWHLSTAPAGISKDQREAESEGDGYGEGCGRTMVMDKG